ncbi:hypothetical protein NKI15_03160 [Mesorhizobium sp. M0862]|uniref:hypothetical protein n=1 Tax=Mesorhizobium sp. M0862 TaxID=2957015 RepID=UPI0033365874
MRSKAHSFFPTLLTAGRAKADDADKRLLVWDEAVKGETQALAATAFQHVDTRNLRRLTITHDGSTTDGVKADCLGVLGIADVATDFYVEINPEHLLPGVGTVKPIFRASATAEFKAGFKSPFGAGAVDAVYRRFRRIRVWLPFQRLRQPTS